MVQKFNVSTSGITEDFVIRLWEATNDTPGGIIYEQTLVEKDGGGTPTPGAGHQVIETVTVNGLDKVVHIIRMFGAVSGTKYLDVNVEPKYDLITLFLPIRFKIGDGNPGTPASGDNTYVNANLVGLSEDDYTIFRNNYGFLFPELHYTIDAGAGSFSLVGDDQFTGPPDTESGEEFTIQIQPQKSTSNVNDSVVAKLFGQTPASDDVFVDINANTNYDAVTHLRKYLRLNGSAQFTFLDNPPIGYGFTFGKFGNTGGTARVNFTNAPLLWTGGTTKAFIDFTDGMEGCFFWDGAVWNAVFVSQATLAVGGGGGIAANTIVGTGIVAIGDVPAGDPIYEVAHNFNITGDYMVFIAIKSNNEANYYKNNKIGITWWHHETVGMKPNRFKFSLQEISGEGQDCSANWMIVKM